MNIFDYISNYFTPSEPPPPVFGLENKSPYHPQAGIYIGNHGFSDRRLPDDYWQKLNYYRGQQVMPSGYTGNIATGPDAHLQDFGPIDSQYRTNRLIYPDEIAPRQGQLGGLIYNDYQRRDARPLFVNGVQYPPRAPIEKSPRLTEKRLVIRMNTPAEKAAYLASQAERGFTLVGDPYTPVTDTRLAPTTMLSTERIPFYGDYRAGQATASGRPFMTAGQAMRYVPHYLNDPRTLEALSANAGRAVQGLAIGVTPIDALNRREANFTDFYERTGRDPSTLENYGLRIQSGLEPALNLATFGMYDYLADTPTFKKFKEEEARSRGARKKRQEGIDKPYIGTKRFERTTK